MSIQIYGHSFRILGVFRFLIKYDCYNWYSLKENIWIFQMFSFLIDEKEILIGYIVGLVLLLRILFPDRRIKYR
nr:MAG TPA: hypothetical protein [Microviridae sp.]